MADEQLTTETSENPYANLELISKRIDKANQADKFYRAMFEREWFTAILFQLGCHYHIYDGGKFRAKKLPVWYPKAQTNKFAEKNNDLVSSIIQIGRVPIRYTPSKTDPDCIATAEIGEAFREVMYAEADMDNKRYEMANWLILTGNVFLLPYYDTDDKYGVVDVQSQRCTQCGAISPLPEMAKYGGCPECEAEDAEGLFEPAFEQIAPEDDPEGTPVDDTTKPIMEQVPIGAFQTDIVSPFEIRIDHRVTRMCDQQRFLRVRRYDLEYAKQHWKDATLPTGEPVVIQADSNSEMSQFYLDILSHATSNYMGAGASSENGSNNRERVTAYEFFELPSKEFPEGLHAIRLGQTANGIVLAKPLETEYGAGARKGKKFLPLVHIGFDKVPGRFWYKSRMLDVIPLQQFRNIVEAMLWLTTRRMVNPIWLIPKGSGVDNVTGEPGQIVTYNPVSLGGTSFAKPERSEGTLGSIQPLVLLMNKIDEQIEKVAGTYFVASGDVPSGVSAASALALLGEKAQKALSALYINWAQGFEDWEGMGLEIARANWTDERIRVIAGRNREWETQTFKNADLMGSVNMDIDYKGLTPKSNATDRAEIAQLIQLQVVNPTDPQQAYEILKMFGKTKLLGTVDIDEREAAKENERFLLPDDDKDHREPMLVPLIQNSQIHISVHSDLTKTDEFKSLPPEKQQRMFAHIQAHFQDAVAYQQTMQAATQAAGMPSGQAPQGEGVPSGAIPEDKGASPADEVNQTPDIAMGTETSAEPVI